MKNLSEGFVRQILNSAPEASIISDANGFIVFANFQMQSLFGYEPRELVDQSLEILLPERYRDAHPGHRHSFLRNPGIRPMGQGLKLRGQHKNGKEIPVEISLSPVETSEGLFVCAAIRDITVHRDMEERLTGILDKSLNEIFVFSSNNLRFIQVNEGARKNLGYSMNELQNMTPVDIKPEYTQEQFQELIAPLRENLQENLVFETLHQRKDGSTYPVEIHLQFSQHEAAPVFAAIVLDITERKRAENLLRESNELLEKRVIERTLALEEARIYADQANKGKSRFLAAASHDLRQPLQSLGLYLSVMTRKLSQPDTMDATRLMEISDKMRGSLDIMAQLLDALLDISKLDAGSITPQKCDVGIGELLDRIVTDNIQQAEEKGLRLNSLSEDCVVYTDAALFERILENFVTNAIRYTEEGTITVECHCANGIAKISVIDTGIGIPKDMLDKVFDEYYQLDNQSRDRNKGLGLGLSIVRHIAKLLDHPLSVSSELGKGSTFTIEVPLGMNETSFSEQGTPTPDSVRGEHIPVVLLVDDDPAVLDATLMILELSDLQVYSASCGEEALQHIDSGVRPDILVSDYRLPGYDGLELVRRVRQKNLEGLPVVLVTGDTSASDIDAAGLSNVTLLRKPVDTEQLVALIGKLSK